MQEKNKSRRGYLLSRRGYLLSRRGYLLSRGGDLLSRRGELLSRSSELNSLTVSMFDTALLITDLNVDTRGAYIFKHAVLCIL
jgi:hypothetical protein